MTTELKLFKKQLPKRGYLALIKEFVVDSEKTPLVTSDQIHNFWQGRAVSPEAQIIIIKAAKKAIEKRKAAQDKLKALMTLK